jgi:CheY-like chemotaxis protein
MRSLVCTFLGGFGVKNVREAADAEQAYEEYMGFDPDLIITDWNMAGTSGLDFVSNVRNNPESPNPYVPIILLTGYTEMYRVSQARDRGINFYLAKPVSASSLYKRLVAVVSDDRPFVRSQRFFGPCRRAAKRGDNDYGGVERRKRAPVARSAR